METVIQVDHLTHRYGNRTAVEDLSFHVERGEVLGLLGPNGAGKTTTVRLLNGLFAPVMARSACWAWIRYLMALAFASRRAY